MSVAAVGTGLFMVGLGGLLILACAGIFKDADAAAKRYEEIEKQIAEMRKANKGNNQ